MKAWHNKVFSQYMSTPFHSPMWTKIWIFYGPSHKICQGTLGLCFKTEGKLGYHVAKSTSPVALTAQNETVSKQLQESVSSSYSEQHRNFKSILTHTTLIMVHNFQNN